MRILCIPDVHNKPWIFDEADKLLAEKKADCAVQIGDLLDDWGQEFAIEQYSRTLQRCIKFHKDHPDTVWIMGDHDFSYHHTEIPYKNSGHSKFVEGEVNTWLRQMERIGASQQIIHVIDGVIFTHAGLGMDWVKSLVPRGTHWEDDLEYVYNLVKSASTQELWEDVGPLWLRPQLYPTEMCPAKLQVVGHTPIEYPYEQNGVLSTDTFSTCRDGAPLGDQNFCIVDTETGLWQPTKEILHE